MNRLGVRAWLVLGALLVTVTLLATDQIVPATTEYQAQMRIWLAARATGVTAFIVLTVLVTFGLVLSHPVNQSTWKLSKRIFPWHENLFVFVVAFTLVHALSLALDPYAGVGFQGVFIPGLSSYRSLPVALGCIGMYALVLTGLTARYTKSLPSGWWLKLHRLSMAVFILAWVHGMLSGTDSDALRPLYIAAGIALVCAASYRYWVGRRRRPTFATSLPDAQPTAASPPTDSEAHAT